MDAGRWTVEDEVVVSVEVDVLVGVVAGGSVLVGVSVMGMGCVGVEAAPWSTSSSVVTSA